MLVRYRLAKGHAIVIVASYVELMKKNEYQEKLKNEYPACMGLSWRTHSVDEKKLVGVIYFQSTPKIWRTWEESDFN